MWTQHNSNCQINYKSDLEHKGGREKKVAGSEEVSAAKFFILFFLISTVWKLGSFKFEAQASLVQLAGIQQAIFLPLPKSLPPSFLGDFRIFEVLREGYVPTIIFKTDQLTQLFG